MVGPLEAGGLARLSLGVQVLEAASSVIVHLEAAD